MRTPFVTEDVKDFDEVRDVGINKFVSFKGSVSNSKDISCVVDPDPLGSAWIRNFCLDPELKFRTQQKVKEQINKSVSSGLFVL